MDLTGVAKNIAVNLSFDLLGFGASNNNVTLRDTRVHQRQAICYLPKAGRN
ncbi:MAG: hypothetical protein ABIS30_00280 [Gallionella sp.]